jgi:phosphatidylinositol alpha-1,6-mannosyltransferase
MRYLILTPCISGMDGVSSLTRRVAVALTELGADIEVWSLLDDPGADIDVGRKTLCVRGAAGVKARAVAWSLAGFLRDARDLTVVVMHVHLSPLSLPLQARGARIFHVLHGIEVWKPLSALQAKAFRAAERLVCVSAHTARRFDADNPGFETTVCHSGLPVVSARELSDDGCALIVGRMSSSERYKGHDLLLDVWAEVVRRAPHAKLVVVGDGDDRERLMEKSHRLGVDDVVRFAGSLSDEDLENEYRRCSLFVMPSVNEGFGLVFLEAMRVSKPCIGATGAASEIIDNEQTGFVVQAEDGASLTRVLVELFNDPAKRAAMGARGRERFEREFTSDRFRERLNAIFEIPTPE